MDHAPVLVTVKDRDGRYTFVNRAFEQRVGKPEQSFSARHPARR